MTRPADYVVAQSCPRCAEHVAPDISECGFCGHVLTQRKPLLTRIAEVASLAAVLALIIVVCGGLGRLIGL